MDSNDKYIHDAYISMAERTIKRLWILCIIIFLTLVGSNLAWLHHESQFVDEETTTIDASQDGGGTNIIGGGQRILWGRESELPRLDEGFVRPVVKVDTENVICVMELAE